MSVVIKNNCIILTNDLEFIKFEFEGVINEVAILEKAKAVEGLENARYAISYKEAKDMYLQLQQLLEGEGEEGEEGECIYACCDEVNN